MVLNSNFVGSLKHQVRWMKSTRFSRPKGHFGTALTFSMPFGLLGLAARLGSAIPAGASRFSHSPSPRAWRFPSPSAGSWCATAVGSACSFSIPSAI